MLQRLHLSSISHSLLSFLFCLTDPLSPPPHRGQDDFLAAPSKTNRSQPEFSRLRNTTDKQASFWNMVIFYFFFFFFLLHFLLGSGIRVVPGLHLRGTAEASIRHFCTMFPFFFFFFLFLSLALSALPVSHPALVLLPARVFAAMASAPMV